MDDKRKWYASQHQSMAELSALKERILESFLPSAETDLDSMLEPELSQELTRRKTLAAEWDYKYWELFIPFAHGVRLFGETFLNSMEALGKLDEGKKLLALARLSYRMRDDDNIMVARVSGEYYRAEEVYQRRFSTGEEQAGEKKMERTKLHRRQVTGTSASSGIAAGRARIILNAEDLFKVQKGEVLVCDSIDPNMTFVIPLAAAIVEGRGGMLVHGAIIAREYGIPCITGISNAVNIIETGNMVTVDGYLGIVTISA